jgi:lysophospholipase L1-like esterase
VALLASPSWAGQARYLDLYPSFVDSQGGQIGRLFTDGLHPNEDGYRVWRDRLLLALQQARQKP